MSPLFLLFSQLRPCSLTILYLIHFSHVVEFTLPFPKSLPPTAHLEDPKDKYGVTHFLFASVKGVQSKVPIHVEYIQVFARRKSNRIEPVDRVVDGISEEGERDINRRMIIIGAHHHAIHRINKIRCYISVSRVLFRSPYALRVFRLSPSGYRDLSINCLLVSGLHFQVGIL